MTAVGIPPDEVGQLPASAVDEAIIKSCPA